MELGFWLIDPLWGHPAQQDTVWERLTAPSISLQEEIIGNSVEPEICSSVIMSSAGWGNHPLSEESICHSTRSYFCCLILTHYEDDLQQKITGHRSKHDTSPGCYGVDLSIHVSEPDGRPLSRKCWP